MKVVRKQKLSMLVLFLACVGTISAQQKQNVLKERFNVNKDVTIKVDTRYTNVIFETWDKDEVSVEGFIETTKNISENDLKNIVKNWKLNTSGNSNEIIINSGGNLSWNGTANMDLSALESLKDMPMDLDFLGPIVEGMLNPLTEGVAGDLPKNFYKNMRDVDFDYQAYKKNPDGYMKSYEAKMKERFGDDFDVDMKAWGKDFGKKMEAWNKQFEAVFGKDIAQWGENFQEEYGPKLEVLAEQLSENYGNEYIKTETVSPSGKTTVIEYSTVRPGNFTNDNVKRTIIIKMPKDARLRLDVRHGEIKLAERIKNIQANLSHTRLSANIIDGGQTSIAAAYSPVNVKQWNYGTLSTNYVKECVIENAKNIKIISKSSDIVIKNLEEIGIISGTFSRIAIPEIGKSITNLDVVLENSDFIIDLPESAFNFTFNGSKSGLKFPPSLQVQTVKNANNDRVTGFYKSRNTTTNLAISARFSNVILK